MVVEAVKLVWSGARRLCIHLSKSSASTTHIGFSQTSHNSNFVRERQPPAPPTTSHVLTTVAQNGLSIRAMLRQEEDRHCCRPLQGTPRRRRRRAHVAHAETAAAAY